LSREQRFLYVLIFVVGMASLEWLVDRSILGYAAGD
jgi:hypothetical protein